MLPDLNDARWRKSSASGGEGTQCVELHPDGAVRDSKNPGGPVLPVDLPGLVAAVKAMPGPAGR
jgi:hypothetical protein